MYLLDDKDNIGEFEFVTKFEETTSSPHRYKSVFVHSDRSKIVVSYVEDNWPFTVIELDDVAKENSIYTRFGDIPEVYLDDVARYYEENNHFGASLNHTLANDALDNILSNYEIEDQPDDSELSFEEYASRRNTLTDLYPIEEYTGTAGKLLEQFLKNTYACLWVYGSEIRWAKSLDAYGYLYRLTDCYNYDPEMFYDDSWVTVAEQKDHLRLDE